MKNKKKYYLYTMNMNVLNAISVVLVIASILLVALIGAIAVARRGGALQTVFLPHCRPDGGHFILIRKLPFIYGAFRRHSDVRIIELIHI